MRPGEELVDCGSCSACCRREGIYLIEGDEPADYEHKLPLEGPALEALAELKVKALGWRIPHKRGGACVYLEAGRCSIWDKRPVLCRKFTCVGFVRNLRRELPRVEIRRMIRGEMIDKAVWQAGVARGG